MASVDEFVNSSAWLMKVSGAQRGRSRHAAPTADVHGARIAALALPPRPLFPPRTAAAMDLADVPRHRPMAFDKMESLIKEMQDPETGVPVRSQKLFLTYIPAAFMGYDLVEWLMERFNLDETANGEFNFEAINLANLLCQYGYFFPVNDSKNLVLKDDSSLYRFQSPYYWPWQAPRVAGGSSAPTLGPDNVEYAIYLVKRTLRNKQRHGLEEYELETLANLKKNLAAKWDFITMQAEEQVRLAKDRKKGDKIVSDSQERAYWRVARPPPGMPSALEPCPVPVRTKNLKPKKRTVEQITREIELLKASLDRTRVKTSIALEALLAYSETFAPYDPWLTPPQPSNPWVSDDTFFWQINSPLVEVPTEKRVQRWAISIEELVADPTGLQEFTSFLRKEYSHENIRFWLAVMDLRRSSVKQIPKKLDEICEEFLKPGAPCEINIDGATAEKVAEGVRSGSRYALDHAAEHVYSLLLKKDCYPRFVRSDHFQRLLAEGKNVALKKAKFFNFGGQVKKKPGPATGPSGSGAGGPGLSRRRGSDRSLSGSAHELAVSAAQPPRAPDAAPSHSHSQSNLADISRDPDDDTNDVMPWESASREVYGAGGSGGARRRQDSAADSGSSSSDLSGVAERRRLPQQSTLDGGLRGAPPPLRRLSAVEPRHLAPLASPPRSPRASPAAAAPPPAAAAAAAPQPPPHPTPTISVSSAPEDGSPDEAASAAHSDDPPSVFATPTHETIGELEHSVSGSDVQVTVSECDERHSVVCDPTSQPRTLVREPSTTTETSPASCRDTQSEILDLPESSCSTVASIAPSQLAETTVTTMTTETTRSASPCKETEVIASISNAAPASVTAESDSAVLTEEATESLSTSAPPSSLTATPPPAAATPAPPAAPPAHALVLPPPPRAAPLAVCEDIIDDDVDKVPSAPLQAVAVAAKPDAAMNIAHKDSSSSGAARCGSTGGHGDRAQRNDVCPWEDENSCESEAPFVKTYATLGYL